MQLDMNEGNECINMATRRVPIKTLTLKMETARHLHAIV